MSRFKARETCHHPSPSAVFHEERTPSDHHAEVEIGQQQAFPRFYAPSWLAIQASPWDLSYPLTTAGEFSGNKFPTTTFKPLTKTGEMPRRTKGGYFTHQEYIEFLAPAEKFTKWGPVGRCNHESDVKYNYFTESTLPEHKLVSGHNLSFGRTKVLSKTASYYPRKHEAIEIKKHSNNINKDQGNTIII